RVDVALRLVELEAEPHEATFRHVVELREPGAGPAKQGERRRSRPGQRIAAVQQAGEPCDVRVAGRVAVLDRVAEALGDEHLPHVRVGHRVERRLEDRPRLAPR
ncbi:MAG: hypothetical protein ACK559_18945, partial [bacterium]